MQRRRKEKIMAEELVEKKPQSFSMALTEELDNASDSLPFGFNTSRFVTNAVALLNGNELLADFAKKFGTAQIKQGMMRGAYLGVDFMNKEAYLIPYGNKLDFMLDYRGCEKLAKRYSTRPILDITSKIVREGDVFETGIKDGKEFIEFHPKPFSDGKVIGAFAYVSFKDGGFICDQMSVKELENSRNQSKAKNSPAWSRFTTEMYRKIVLKRLLKHVPIDFDAPIQYEIFNDDGALADVEDIRKSDIEEYANKEEFIDG